MELVPPEAALLLSANAAGAPRRSSVSHEESQR